MIANLNSLLPTNYGQQPDICQDRAEVVSHASASLIGALRYLPLSPSALWTVSVTQAKAMWDPCVFLAHSSLSGAWVVINKYLLSEQLYSPTPRERQSKGFPPAPPSPPSKSVSPPELEGRNWTECQVLKDKQQLPVSSWTIFLALSAQ